MNCIITYKGKKYSEEQFLQYLSRQIAINNLFNENKTLSNSVYETLEFDLPDNRYSILKEFKTYDDYKNRPNMPSYNEAFWLADGSLPNMSVYPSDYFVRLRNASKYKPYTPGGHYHPTTQSEIKLIDNNLDVFKLVNIPIVNRKIGVKIYKKGK